MCRIWFSSCSFSRSVILLAARCSFHCPLQWHQCQADNYDENFDMWSLIHITKLIEGFQNSMKRRIVNSFSWSPKSHSTRRQTRRGVSKYFQMNLHQNVAAMVSCGTILEVNRSFQGCNHPPFHLKDRSNFHQSWRLCARSATTYLVDCILRMQNLRRE